MLNQSEKDMAMLPPLTERDVWDMTMLMVVRDYHEREYARFKSAEVKKQILGDTNGMKAILRDLTAQNEGVFRYTFDTAKNIVRVRRNGRVVATVDMDGLHDTSARR